MHPVIEKKYEELPLGVRSSLLLDTPTEPIEPSSPEGWFNALYIKKSKRDCETKSSTTRGEHVPVKVGIAVVEVDVVVILVVEVIGVEVLVVLVDEVLVEELVDVAPELPQSNLISLNSHLELA